MTRSPADQPITVGGTAGHAGSEPELPEVERRDTKPPGPARVIPALTPFAGPFLIAGSVILILKDFATGLLFPRPFELVGEWLTTFCFTGRTLRTGHIPSLNAHVMGGIPFAPDPQSGWLNLPAMGLFSVLRCDLALRAYLILLPILAGLGIYWFLRSEGLGRPAATVGGLVLALPLAGSRNFMLPWVAGWLAWTAVVLATASRFWHAEEPWRRVLWAIACALAWSQLASAHFSTGMGVGTGFLIAYLVTQSLREVLGKRSTGLRSFGRVVFLLAAVLAVNLAAILPRVVYVRRTPLGLGFAQLQTLVVQFRGGNPGVGRALPAGWPVSMALSPGVHQGAIALALCFGGFMVRQRRALAAVFAAVGAACYALTLPVTERTLQPLIENSSFSHTYLHGPTRIQPGVFVAVAVLAGLGVEAWMRARSIRERAMIAAPGLLVWTVLLVAFHPPAARLALLAVGAALGLFALLASVRVRTLALLVPVVLATELWLSGRPLSGAALAAISRDSRGARRVAFVDSLPLWTKLDVAAYLRPGPIAAALQAQDGGRYVTSVPQGFNVNGYFGRVTPSSWGLMGNQQSMIFGLREAQGYDATLPIRYWEFVRAVEPGKKINYPPDYFIRPPDVALDLLQIGWVVGEAGASPPVPNAVPVARQGRWALYRLPRTPPMASVVGDWVVVGSADDALDEVTALGFDPGSKIVLERNPGLAAPARGVGPAGEATYRQLGDQAATVQVQASRPAIVLVRNTYDPNWHASVDGRRVTVLAADSVIQGIPVPAGRHLVRLWYDDPTVRHGLAGSAVSLALLAAAAVVLHLRPRSDLSAQP
jgi:hypothetical protein